MKAALLIGAAVLAALPASAQQTPRTALIAGHPIVDESTHQAGVAMALTITPNQQDQPDLIALCRELRIAAALAEKKDGHLLLENIFVVPRKAMAIEGLYWPDDGSEEEHALVAGRTVARPLLDSIVTRVGIPPEILDEKKVEHEVSCSTIEPVWNVAWQDVQPIGEDDPDTVIERARERFMAVYRSVVEHGGEREQVMHTLPAPGSG